MTDKTVEIHRDSGMRLVARTGSGHEVVVDDATGDRGPRPTELVIVGLGTCTAMDVISILRKKRQDVTRFDVYVRATQRSAYPQIFTDIEMVVEVEGPGVSVTAVRQAIELAARKYCSVGAMLAAGETVDPPPIPGDRDGCGPLRRDRRGPGQRPLRPTGSSLKASGASVRGVSGIHSVADAIGRRGRQDVGHRSLRQPGQDGYLGLREHRVHVTEGAWLSAQTSREHAGLPTRIAFDRLDDLEDADEPGVLGQAVATSPAEVGLHDTRTAEVSKHVGEETPRDVLTLRDRASGYHFDAILVRQRQDGADGVGGAARQI